MKSKTRRKMTFRRFAYYLLIAAIVVSCVANGIFAKFTTEDDGGDGARVAKFGIVLSVAGDLFSTAYSMYSTDDLKDDGGNVIFEKINSNMPTVYAKATEGDFISVLATTKETEGKLNNVIAPGTKSADGMNIQIKGTAETDCVIEYKVDMETVFLRTIIPDEYTLSYGYLYEYSKGGQQINYCVMVPMKENIIREDNFEEFKDTLYTASTVGGATTYKKVNGNFNSDADYYQAEDVIGTISNDYYTPIVYYIDGRSSIAGHDEDEKLEDALIPIMHPWLYDERGKATGSTDLEYFIKEIIGASFTGVESDLEENTTVITDAENVSPYSRATSEGKSNIIETGTELDIDLDLKWYWDFIMTSGGREDLYANGCDTILGHLMNDKLTKQKTVFKTLDGGDTYIEPVEGEDYNLNVDFDINITINQVD